jgi:hypothetical protein
VIVPVGALTGSSFIVRFIEWLYHITGQREDGIYQHIIEFFNANGFDLQIVEERLPRSRAWVLIATRKSP